MTRIEQRDNLTGRQDSPAAYRQRFEVGFEYPVHFTRDVFAPESDLLAGVLGDCGEDGPHRAIVCVDSGLAKAQPELVARIEGYFAARADAMQLTLAGPVEIVPGGPATKIGWDAAQEMVETFAARRLDRHCYVIAVGGGSMLDMVGFAASIVHRGLRLVRLPTTTLAQNDAGVGVKTGLDVCGVKNLIGTFAPPFAVINDFDMTATLTQEHWIAGLAEAMKVAIIKDREFFEFLCSRGVELRSRDGVAMAEAVRRCAMLHLDHIRTSGDPFETGSARPLDFGHWIAHKLEAMSNFQIGHGQAVAVGIAADSYYACRTGLLSEGELDQIIAGLAGCGLEVYSDLLAARTADGSLEILGGLADFREHLGGRLSVTLPRNIGERIEVHQIDATIVGEAVRWLKTRSHTIQGHAG